MPSKHYKKYIRIPPSESVDIRRIYSIINHPLFQRLLHISQLATTLNVFPGASHNRFEHALGVYSKTSRFCTKMVADGFLTEKQALNVSLFGLLHDIGHGPFSHVIEELTPFNHDKNGARIIKQLKKEIKEAGGDFKLIQKMFDRKSNLYRIVMDKNVGMDKLDYLERDIFHTGFGQRPDIESIFNYLSWINNRLVIDKKSFEAAKQIQRLYLYMFKEVYLHKASVISQRFIQKIIALWMSIDKIANSDLWLLNDHELISKLYSSKDPRIKLLYESFRSRILPRTGLVIRLEDRIFKERLAGKDIKVIGEKLLFFNKLAKHSSPQELEKIENKIAKALKVPDYKVMVVPMVTPWRFIPEDILYHDDGEILSLKKTNSEYFESLKLELNDYLAVRVCILGNRNIISQNSQLVYQTILDYLKTKKG